MNHAIILQTTLLPTLLDFYAGSFSWRCHYSGSLLNPYSTEIKIVVSFGFFQTHSLEKARDFYENDLAMSSEYKNYPIF